MGIPLLFTSLGSTQLVLVPPGDLYPGDELYPGDDIYPDEGPSLVFSGTTVTINLQGLTLAVTPVEVVFSGGVATMSPAGSGTGAAVDSGAVGALPVGEAPVGGDDIQLAAVSGQITLAVTPATVLFSGTPATLSGVQLVLAPLNDGQVTFSMPVPGITGGMLLILIPSVRELPPLRLTIDVETPSGRHFRWAEDERNPVNVPNGLRFSDTMPGGFESQDVTLPRKTGMGGADLERLSTITTHGAGGQIAWQGRLERAPRTSGDQVSVSPSAVGWQAHLDDDKSARMIYVDRDFSGWGPQPPQRQIDNDFFGFDASEMSVGPSLVEAKTSKASPPTGTLTGLPALGGTLKGPLWTRKPLVESWYDAGPGVTIGFVHYGWRRSSTIALPDSNWVWSIFAATDNRPISFDSTGNVSPNSAALAGSGNLTVPGRGRRYLGAQFFYNAATDTPDVDYSLFWTCLAVYGDHGLPVHGLADDLNAPGVLASDIVTHAVSRWAPLLSTAGVSPSSYSIPHLTFKDSTSAAEIVKGATRFGLEDWAVWDNKTFWFHDRGSHSRYWRARVGPSQLSETGPQIDRLWNSAIVQYQDVDGSTRTVGPPGAGVDVSDPSLLDTDPENPANVAGVTRRTLLTTGVATPASAIEIGRRFLEEQKLLDTSGQARIVGHVENDRGVLFPYWAPRAGDYISFLDASDTSYRRIVKTDKDHASRTCSVDLDSPPEGLQALLERLGVGLVDLGLS